MKTTQEKAKLALTYFTTKTRGNGEEFVNIKANSPKWVETMSYEAHGDMMPDDWRYKFIVEALEAIAEGEDPETAADVLEADIYTSKLLDWLASNLNRPGYVDEGAEFYGIEAKNGVMDLITHGQLFEKHVFR